MDGHPSVDGRHLPLFIVTPISSAHTAFYKHRCSLWASLEAQMVKNPPAMQETWVQSLCQEDPLEKGMATHSSILAWRLPWIEEPGGLQPIGSQRVGHD